MSESVGAASRFLNQIDDNALEARRVDLQDSEVYLVHSRLQEGILPLAIAYEDQVNYSMNLNMVEGGEELQRPTSGDVTEELYTHPAVSRLEYTEEHAVRQKKLVEAAKTITEEGTSLQDVREALNPNCEANITSKMEKYY
ncbi:MAG: hypothetical protein ACLFTA_00520 [Candidatus Nanohaloarchaea archaeon]